MKKVAISLIRFYKNLSEVISAYQLSPFFYSGCRHYPTCSEYSILAIEKFGVMKGSYKAFLRILRCNSLSHKFYDPI